MHTMTDDRSEDSYRAYGPRSFLSDRWLSLILFAIACFGVFAMAVAQDVSVQGAVIIVASMVVFFVIALGWDYLRQKRYWADARLAIENADTVAQAMSLLQEPHSLECRLSFDLAERMETLANKESTSARAASSQYREYIELWIHEVKTPIAAAKLTLSRMSGPDVDVLSSEIERIENQVEQALYYARASAVHNDYSIRNVDLAHCVKEACKRQARFMIENQTIPDIRIDDGVSVLTDEPWLVFMLGQVLVNSSQYGASNVVFEAFEVDPGSPSGHTVLRVEDDGIGVSEADAPRVFDRGFTGTNGRARANATGMGLYLIANLCDWLGMGVSMESEEGKGSAVVFSFPHDRRNMDALKLTTT